MPDEISLARRRMDVARTTQDLRRNPADESTKARLARQRAEYAEAKIADYVKKVVDAAPPLTDEQVERLSAIFQSVKVDAVDLAA